MRKILMYFHGGSGNKGCEAIVRSTLDIIGAEKEETILSSWNPNEDKNAGLDEICNIELGKRLNSKKTVSKIINRLLVMVTQNYESEFKRIYSPFIKADYRDSISLSIGGDNYCYEGSPIVVYRHNKILRKNGNKTVLWGCSVDDTYFTDYVIEDFKAYDAIFARESISYDMLVKRGLTNVKLFPDPAFTLKAQEVELPDIFNNGSVVGLNLSPHALRFANNSKAVRESFEELIKYIFENTDMSIALISHVVKPGNSDYKVMKEFFEKYKDSGRMALVDPDLNCRQVKYIISKCRFFVGARTHSTIAAYSTCVPTLVIGYSIKARGIARDIFGEEGKYILETQKISSKGDLIAEFKNLVDNEGEIRNYLANIMPEYIGRAKSAGEEINKMR